jgi:L-iditol 2-dehydrogenase
MTLSEVPTTVRAAVIEAFDKPLTVSELPVPDLAPGSVLVKMDAATVCGTDVHFWRGRFASPFPVTLPVIPGHEGVGTVVGFGDGSQLDSTGQALQVGDRIIWAHAPCGECAVCNVARTPEMCPNLRVGYLNSCQEPPYISGTFGEYAYVHPKAPRVRVPDAVPSHWASAASCALRSVVHAFDRLGELDSSHTVVVQGSGAVGLFATALAAVHHPRRLIVIGDPPSRLELAQRWGADTVISVAESATPEERIELVRQATDGAGADVVMDMAGAPGAIGEGLEMIARNGRYLVIGTTGAGTQPIRAQLLVTRAVRLIGSFSGHIGDYHKALQFMEQHRQRFDWEALFGQTYGLEDVASALEAVQEGREIKPIIVASANHKSATP